MQRWKRGFTLIELVVVIAIIGILAGIALPRFAEEREKAYRAVDVANVRAIESEIALLVTKGQITFPASAVDSVSGNGLWVVVWRDADSKPGDYSGITGTNMFCGTDTNVKVNGVESSSYNSPNTELTKIVRDCFGSNAMHSNAHWDETVEGVGGWDWYMVEFQYVNGSMQGRIYSGQKGANPGIANAGNSGESNIEKYITYLSTGKN